MQTTLYIATHNLTGKKYFGKTKRYFSVNELQEKYHGSGTYWTNYLKKYGDDVTMEIYGIFDDKDVANIAISFSEKNNIVESDKWANLIVENGLDGVNLDGMVQVLILETGICTYVSQDEYYNNKELYHSRMVGNDYGKKTKDTVPVKGYGRVSQEEFKSGNYESVLKGYKYKNEVCPHCGFEGSGGNMKRYHFNNCHKISPINKAFNVYDINDKLIYHSISAREVRDFNQQLMFTNKNQRLGRTQSSKTALINNGKVYQIGMYIEETKK